MEQNNQSVEFPDNIEQILSDITKKYGINETRDQAIEALKKGNVPKAPFIARMAKEYFLKNISDADLINQLKSGLNVSEDIAKEISLDIKNQIIPQTKILTNKADVDFVIDNIIKKYNLNESPATEKINFVAESFVAKKVSLKEMADYIQKELNVFPQVAMQISSDISDNVIPILSKVSPEQKTEPVSTDNASAPIIVDNIKRIENTKPIIKSPVIKNNLTAPKKIQKIKKITVVAPQENIKPTPSQQSGSDKYREPIE